MTDLTLQEIQAQAAAILKTMDISYRGVEPQVLYSRYHQAAAVLTMFTPDTLQPAPGSGAATPVDLNKLLQDCTAVGGVNSACYTLREEVRRDVLQELGSRTAMLAALQANPTRPTDATQTMLEFYLQDNAPPLEKQNAKEIAGTFQVVQWLAGLIDGLPPLNAVQQRWEMLDLLHTFDVLAGAKFRGREAELAVLHSYVLEPSPDGSRRPPLVFYGPGGVGKSALLARFIQEMIARPNTQAAPWGYIDFDRPGIDAEEPLTIIIEALRQLGIQYPAERQYIERFRKGLQDDLLKRVQVTREVNRPVSKQAVIGKGERQEDWWSYLGNFANLLFSLGAGQQPYLLALDTLEEVQYRSSAVVQRLFRFLQALQDKAPMTRPVLAGRNPVTVPGFTVDNRELDRFQPNAAQALLEDEGMPAALAQKIVKQVGTSPLSLRLTLDLWRRGQTGDGILFDIHEGQIEGVLFARLLKHVHEENKEVEPLVHPGLVLRRITPEIIREVLAKHCGIKVRDEADAENLFDKLAREEALVTLEGRVLRHRADVRIIMVRLLRRTEHDTVKKIEKAAVRYYSAQESPEERAEEIYHRLSLQQSLRLIDKRWADAEKRGWTEQMRRSLFSAREELEPRERAWLAGKLGFELTPEEEAQADQQTWEHEAEKRARRYLEDNDPARALAEINKRPHWLPCSPLYLLALQAYELLGDWQAAAEVAERGIQSAAEKGDRTLAVLLRLRGARIDLQRDDPVAARQKLDGAERLVQGSRDGMAPLQLLEIGLYRLVTARQGGDELGTDAALTKLLENFAQIPDALALRDPALLAWLATELGRRQPPVMARILRLIGLPASPEVENDLIVALAEWDQSVARAAGAAPGLLARQLGATPEPNATLSQIWRAFLADRKPEARGAAIAQLLAEQADVPDAVLAALAKAMLLRAGERAFVRVLIPAPEASARAVVPTAQDTSAPSIPRPDQLWLNSRRLTSEQNRQFMDALLTAFNSRRDLDEMLRSRLDKRLETISFSDNMSEIVLQVLERAEREGWSLGLLLAARAARPDNPELGVLADELGLGPIASDQSTLQAFLANTSNLSITEWRSHLGRLETQVCLIKIGDRLSGTGFLLSPDLVMTATDAITDLITDKVGPEAVTCSFDYQGAADGYTVNVGTVFALDSTFFWRDSANGLGYTLLRLAGKSGYSTLGGPNVESTATLRNWITVPDPSPMIAPGSALFILYYTEGGRLRLTFAPKAILRLDARGDLTYPLTPGPVAVGAPCFDANLQLVALHLGEQAGTGYGLSMNAIDHDLAANGYDLRSLQEGIR